MNVIFVESYEVYMEGQARTGPKSKNTKEEQKLTIDIFSIVIKKVCHQHENVGKPPSIRPRDVTVLKMRFKGKIYPHLSRE